ncbi:hypothetical protein KAU45_04855 [bacterium]|nr:hypothetical protein [bacterium]
MGCTFCKALPSEGFNTLALRMLGDPDRGPELAALNRVDERVRPAEVQLRAASYLAPTDYRPHLALALLLTATDPRDLVLDPPE